MHLWIVAANQVTSDLLSYKIFDCNFVRQNTAQNRTYTIHIVYIFNWFSITVWTFLPIDRGQRMLLSKLHHVGQISLIWHLFAHLHSYAKIRHLIIFTKQQMDSFVVFGHNGFEHHLLFIIQCFLIYIIFFKIKRKTAFYFWGYCVSFFCVWYVHCKTVFLQKIKLIMVA